MSALLRRVYSAREIKGTPAVETENVFPNPASTPQKKKAIFQIAFYDSIHYSIPISVKAPGTMTVGVLHEVNTFRAERESQSNF